MFNRLTFAGKFRRSSLGLVPGGSAPSGIRLGVYVNALVGVLGEVIVNLPADARPGVVDWIAGIIDEALDYGVLLSAPTRGLGMRRDSIVVTSAPATHYLFVPDPKDYPDQRVFRPSAYLERDRGRVLGLNVTALICGDPRLPECTARTLGNPPAPICFDGCSWTPITWRSSTGRLRTAIRAGIPPWPESNSVKIVAEPVEGLAIAVTKHGGVRQFPIRELSAPRAFIIDPSGYTPPEEHGYWERPHYQTFLAGDRLILVPVIGNQRGNAALKDRQFIEVISKDFELRRRVWNRIAFGGVIRDYELLFWKQAWEVARIYGWDRRQAANMARDSFARFACGDLFQRAVEQALKLAPSYDPAAGFTPGAFMRQRVRQAIHEEARVLSADVVVPRGKRFTQTISRDAPGMELLGAHLHSAALAVDYELIDRAFDASGRIKWNRIDEAERVPLERHLDVAATFYEAQFNWRNSSKCRVKPKLFGEEARPAAYAHSRMSVDKRTAIPDRSDEDKLDIGRVRSVTGDPDWQRKAKPHSERQVIGCRFPLGTKHQALAHLTAIADRARLGGHPVRFEEWLSWEAGVVPIGTRKDKNGRMTVIYGPGLVRYPRCTKDLNGWSWEYRRKQRRIIRNRVAVITHIGGREQAIRDTEYRRRALIRKLANPVGEKAQPETNLPEPA
jgi:hypothetical protein